MRIIELDLPLSDYHAFIATGRFSEKVKEGLLSIRSILGPFPAFFGKSRSADGMASLFMPEQFQRFDSQDLSLKGAPPITGLIVAASPVHYANIMQRLEPLLGGDVPVVLPFFRAIPDIALVLESQPRSGTHYTLNNLMGYTGWQYATVFDEEVASTTRDGLVNFAPDQSGRPYVVKAHFMQPLHYPAYRYVKTLFLYGWFFDSYYSLGRIESGEGEGYRLCFHSKEWTVLRGYLPLHARWLDYIQTGFCIRYEDYAHDFAATVRKIEGFVEHPLPGFKMPKMNLKRTYFSGRYADHFDKPVFLELLEAFWPCVKRFYPEKVEELQETAQKEWY